MSDKYKIFEGDEAYFVTFTLGSRALAARSTIVQNGTIRHLPLAGARLQRELRIIIFAINNKIKIDIS